MNPYFKTSEAFEVPSDAEIQRLVRRGRKLRAEAVAESGRQVFHALRGLVAAGREKSSETAAALGSKPQGSLT